jgi:hypothetical protein
MKQFLIFVFLVFIFSSSYSRKFYFSSTGNDSYTLTQAQNPATPWKTLIQLENAYRNLMAFRAGDTICFKRGDVFISGRDQFGSMKWWNDGTAYFNAPSGTATNPIVFTNYGDAALALPNFLFPNPCVTPNNQRHCLSFEGVGYLVFDGLQFNDYRFPYADKVSAAFTATGLHLGERANGIAGNKDAHHITVKNCNFSNIGYGIMSSGSYIQISYNNFTNFKSVGDTSGSSIFSDIGSDPIQPQGDHYLIDHNFMKGGWSYSSPYATGQGKVGGAIEVINEFDHSKIIYNTIVDCEGLYEFGRNISGDTLLGPNDDTTAYNLIINCGKMAYLHTGTSQFATRAAKLRFWNNVYIENNFSRFSGINFGKDIYGDGQSFAQFPGWALGYPKNPSDSNYSGHRIIQYASEVVKGNPDTLIDLRNNIIWNTTGLQQLYDNTRTKYKHSNNIYHLVGRKTQPSVLGGVLNANPNLIEIQSLARLFTDTSYINPENWNFYPEAGSPVINFGRNAGIGSDFAGNTIIENPEAGIYEYQSALSNPLTINVSPGSILCNSGSTNVIVSATGGTPPYTGTGTFSATSGTRTFSISDVTGSSKSSTITLSQPNAIVVSLTSGRIITFGGTTTITVMAAGGTGAYTYKLNSGTYQSSNIFSNVRSGVDTIYVKDTNGCTSTSYITITQPSAALVTNATAASLNICNGATTIVTVTGSGGTPPYTGTGNFTVSAGTYTYTILDSNGVSATKSITISQYGAITATVSSGSITSYGGKTTVTVSNASGGLSPYTYSMIGGIFQTSTSFSNIGAGTHNITIKDNRGCTLTKTISISQPASTLNCTATTSGTILCNGATVNVTVAATGGTTPYSGIGTFTVSGGTYNYTVTDAVGAVKTTAITVSQPSAISPIVTASNIIVFGGTTTITVTASGGTGAYTYKLNRGNYQTSNIFSGVPAGTDTIYVKDANGCIASGIITITQPLSVLRANVTTPSNTICNGTTAIVSVTASGGTPPYSGTGSFTVAAGTYNYTVTDSNGVRVTSSITINQYAAITANVNSGTISIFGAKTTVTVSNASNGSSPYTYSINGGAYQTSTSFNNIGAGVHNVNIKDSRGCVLTKSITITQPLSTLNMTATPSGNITCFGGSVPVLVSATRGTAPYTGTGTFNASAGTQTFTVTDAVGSIKSITLNLAQPTSIVPILTSGRIINFGGNTTITATASGGTGTYTYKLNTGSYQTSNTFSNVLAGTHIVYIKDANSCIVSGTLTITQPSALLTASASSTAAILCNGGTTTVNVSGNGGTPPYSGYGTYTVTAGTYNYTITDSNGVTANTSITLNQPTAISATVSSGTIANYGGSTTVSVSSVTGGQSPYTYAINNGAYQTGSTFSNIVAGTHSINIKDSRGCILNKSITIIQPAPLSIVIVSVTHNTCRWLYNGTITIGATGGTPPYRYQIDSWGYSTNNYFNLLGPFTYRLAVKDSRGDSSITNVTILASDVICTAKSSNTINSKSASNTSAIPSLDYEDRSISIFPNPSRSDFTIQLNENFKNINSISLYNSEGVFIKNIPKLTFNKFKINDDLTPGIYFIKVQNGVNIITKKIIKY